MPDDKIQILEERIDRVIGKIDMARTLWATVQADIKIDIERIHEDVADIEKLGIARLDGVNP